MSQGARQGDKETRRQGGCLDSLLSPCLPVSWSILVIGYGNELRGDDAAGPHVARAVVAWKLPQVRALVVHQLTPELAGELALADYAIFVDAYRADRAEARVQVRPIAALPLRDLPGHTGDPQLLLALASALYDRSPHAWWITVPAPRFDYGAELSYTAATGIADALKHIHDLIRSVRSQPCTR